MTQPAALRSKKAFRKTAERGVALKWLVVLAALSIATVLDGISVSDLMKPNDGFTTDQATITLPAERCGPGCSIMVAANISGDAFTARSQ